MNTIEYFLKTKFQETLERSFLLFSKPSSEEKPYEFKYQAKELLNFLLSDDFFSDTNPQNKYYVLVCKAIVYMHLGSIYQETEENHQAFIHFNRSLEFFSQLPFEIVHYFFNYLQELYNIIGLMNLNRDNNEVGLSLLDKSVDLYNSIKEAKYPDQLIVFNSTNYEKRLQTLPEDQKKKLIFRYYYEGGVSTHKTEDLYTHTLFYLAQAYTKLGQKELAAKYCGETMVRQFETKTYQIKDFCVNCISLSDFYVASKNFKQAEYLLLSAIEIIPQDKPKRKLRATLYMSLGRVLLEYLAVSVRIMKDNLFEQEQAYLPTVYNRMSVKFQGINIQIPELKILQNVEEVKIVFRQANTQFKKALEYFVLDGYVTEHLQIQQDIANLYKYFAQLETDRARQQGMLQKRLDILLPLYEQINPKAYQNYHQRLMAMVAEIYSDMFDSKFSELFEDETKKFPKQSKIDVMNELGIKTVQFYSEIFKILQTDTNIEKNSEYYQSVISAKFRIAKVQAKLFYPDKEKRVATLAESLKNYQWIVDYIVNDVRKLGAMESFFEQELAMSKNMVELLPSKIDKINADAFQ